MNQTTSQIKYGQIKVGNFTIYQWNHGQRKNDIETYSTPNEENSVTAERFI